MLVRGRGRAPAPAAGLYMLPGPRSGQVLPYGGESAQSFSSGGEIRDVSMAEPVVPHLSRIFA